MKPVLALALIVLSGCASQPQTMTEQGYPYCYSDEKHVTKNGQTDSTQVVQCTDRPGKQAELLRAGVDNSCEEYWYYEFRYNTRYPVRGVRCEKLDGSWEILNLNGTVR